MLDTSTIPAELLSSEKVPALAPWGALDNIDAMDGMSMLLDNFADSIITDPPYGIGMAKWDYDMPSIAFWKECHRVLKPGGHIVVASAPRLYDIMASRLRRAGFEIRDTLIWHYTQSFPGAYGISGNWRSNLRTNHEPWIVARKPLPARYSLRKCFEEWGTGCVRTGRDGDAWRTNVLSFSKPNAKERNIGAGHLPFPYSLPKSKNSGAWKNSDRHSNTHPTVKPIGLMRELVKTFTPDGGIVIDPFVGSGTTGIAAVVEGYDFFGYEVDPGYWALASERLAFAIENPGEIPL